MSRTSLRGLAVATATVGLFAGTINAVAAAQPDTEAAAAQYAPGMVAAMERDLNLSTAEAVAQLKAQEVLAGTQRSLERSLGASSYAGAWVEGTDELHVAVTDTADAAAVRAAGATPVTVENSLAALDTWTADLDGALSESDVTSYYVDVESNEIVIDVVRGAKADVAAAVAEAGVPASAVSLSTAAERPRTLINVVGGNAYFIGGSRCSVGFAATGGFVTAGHCGSRGAATSQPSGTFQVSSFPGNDYAYVNVGSDDTPIASVNNYNGGTVNVSGSSAAAVGATVCRSGSTTGWHCGTIQALNATVNYSQGSVTGLIRTSVCAEPGDSGGSLLAGTQAQGMTSGGSGNCSSGGTTYFQPVGEALSAAGVSLLTR